jgi:tripartite-type tricarboxylate transporter receptor subunit TctC
LYQRAKALGIGVDDSDVRRTRQQRLRRRPTVMGLYASTGTSPRVVSRLQAEVAKVIREPAITARMEQLGMIIEERGTASCVEFTKRDIERYRAIAHKLNLQVK